MADYVRFCRHSPCRAGWVTFVWLYAISRLVQPEIKWFISRGGSSCFCLKIVDFLNNRQSMPTPTSPATILRSRRAIMVGTVYIRLLHAPPSTPRQDEITSACFKHFIDNVVPLWPYTPVALVHPTHVIAVGENADSRG